MTTLQPRYERRGDEIYCDGEIIGLTAHYPEADALLSAANSQAALVEERDALKKENDFVRTELANEANMGELVRVLFMEPYEKEREALFLANTEVAKLRAALAAVLS